MQCVCREWCIVKGVHACRTLCCRVSKGTLLVDLGAAQCVCAPRLRKRSVETPFLVELSVLEAHVADRFRERAVAAVSLERWYLAPGVRRVEVRQRGVVGTLFLPPGVGPFPAVLDMWGMGGGLSEYRAALLASRGYASLALVYIYHRDLPGPPDQYNVGEDYYQVQGGAGWGETSSLSQH
ncbi:bile acid-CoA:amino acid N-acyltransferase-like isoform X1 [Acipenser oxyrinchus oxyrinchus]|uniref:Bile acid-CoA:amino acid N-acyltransferase-like isoform X1 n=1 Tax=Acipenser oxyrinchus oxyrinchus TaxID=40147 RepID=A0AAD8DIM4_ACIOX|nr:bile acid-CoA:amino acid N-acyltransferase-like isoform X1 [Acipenser oxyrinchus oxyrinchus]